MRMDVYDLDCKRDEMMTTEVMLVFICSNILDTNSVCVLIERYAQVNVGYL